MTVTIELKPETKKRLAEKAKKNGLPIETFIEIFIEDKLDETDEKPEEKTFRQAMSKEDWRIEFRKWMNSHKGKNYPSIPDEALRRENMYEERF